MSTSIEIEIPLIVSELFIDARIIGSEYGITLIPLNQDGRTVQWLSIDKIHKEDDENLLVTIRLTKPKTEDKTSKEYSDAHPHGNDMWDEVKTKKGKL